MTLEERVDRLEQFGSLVKGALDAITKAGGEDHRALCELQAALRELDVMVLAIHAAIKDVQERV